MKLTTRLLQRLPWLVAGAIIVPIVLTDPAFQKAGYWLALSQQFFAPALLALALTPIILTGGIDLSVGSISVLASVVIGALWQEAGWPIEWAVAGGLCAGLLAGTANGSLVALGVMPLVATLATRELFRGLALRLSGHTPVNRFPPELTTFWLNQYAGLPAALYGLIFFFILTYLFVHHTWMGRMVYAAGDNEEAARYAGVPVRALKLLLYAWSGLTAGLCGFALVMKYGAAKADAEKTLELAAIAYVVVGGIRITGGAGRVTGTLLGIVTVSVLQAWLSSRAPAWRDTVIGALLIAVALGNEVGFSWSRRLGG